MLLKKKIDIDRLDPSFIYIYFAKDDIKFGKFIALENNVIVETASHLNNEFHRKIWFKFMRNGVLERVGSIMNGLYFLNDYVFHQFKNKNIWGLKLVKAYRLLKE